MKALLPRALQALELSSPCQARFEMWNIPARMQCTEYRNTWHFICKSFVARFFRYCQNRKYWYRIPLFKRQGVWETERSFKRPSKSDKTSPSKNKRKEAFWYTFAISRCTPCFFHVTAISVELVNHTHYFGALKGQFLPTFLSSCQAQLKLVERKLDGALSFEQNPFIVH